MGPVSMTLSDFWPGFQDHSILEIKYVKTVQDVTIVTVEN